jgi:hypothetical protein
MDSHANSRYSGTVSFFLKLVFLGSFGHLVVLAVGFGASLAGEVSGSNFLSAQGK